MNARVDYWFRHSSSLKAVTEGAYLLKGFAGSLIFTSHDDSVVGRRHRSKLQPA